VSTPENNFTPGGHLLPRGSNFTPGANLFCKELYHSLGGFSGDRLDGGVVSVQVALDRGADVAGRHLGPQEDQRCRQEARWTFFYVLLCFYLYINVFTCYGE
jgi:hypothetical protein